MAKRLNNGEAGEGSGLGAADLRTVQIRALLNCFAAEERQIISQKMIWTEADLSKDTVLRFRRTVEAKNKKIEGRKAETLISAVGSLIDDGKIALDERLLPYAGMLKELLPDNERLALLDDIDFDGLIEAEHDVVADPLIRRMRLPVEMGTNRRAQLVRWLQGFWLLLRPGSELNDLTDPKALTAPGRFSISLLNIIPEEIDKHRRYNFFKLSQGGKPELGIEPFSFFGVVDPGGDRANFSGGRVANESLFSMVAFYNTDHLRRTDHMTEFGGVMMGINAATNTVVSPFHCLYLPDTANLSRDSFKQKNAALKTILGTYDRDAIWNQIAEHWVIQRKDEKESKTAFEERRKAAKETLEAQLDSFIRRFSFTRL